jgi:hypothetical protein
MKLSVEAKVAASIAAGFVALTVGGYYSSSASRTNAEESRHRNEWQLRE